MSAEEIESYNFQLEQVELALQSDPSNEELQKLQHDLKELITMFEAASSTGQTDSPSIKKKQQQPAPAPTTTATALKHHEFSVDQEVMARWSGDGEFYKAIITAIGGADQVFSVKFRGYNEAEFVKAEDIKPLQDKRKRAGVFENVEVPKKKKSSATSTATTSTPAVPKKKKAVEFENKKNAWLNFATGGSKKTKTKAPTVINKKSIFKTPDNPEGKGKIRVIL
jgi:survival-of-motor-neuron-related-splicing factor 30